MRVCIVSSSFYPATFYGGPISSTFGLAKNLAKSGIKIFVSTTNANGKKQLTNVNTTKYNQLAENLFVRYYQFFHVNVK